MKNKEEELDQDQALGKLLRLAGSRPAVPEDLQRRVHDAVHAQWKKSLRVKLWRRKILLAAGTTAAAVLLFVIIPRSLITFTASPGPVGIVEKLTGDVLLIESQNGQRTSKLLSKSQIVHGETSLESGEAGRILLRLIGGATIRMDVNSRLDLKTESQFALHDGAVYVDSGKGKAPVIISTPLGIVRNKGTQFEIRLHDGTLRIRVREGSVSLDHKGQENTADAGSELAINQNGHASLTRVPRYGPAWSWVSEVSPTFHMEGRTLMDFLHWVSRENGWNLHYSDPAIESSAPTIVLHGSIAGMSSDQTPGVVLPVCGLSYSIDAGVLKVSRSRTSLK